MELMLHIGAHKTGSTSIQDYCFLNQDHLLNEGIYYPIGFFRQFPRQHSELMHLVAKNQMDVVSKFFEFAVETAQANKAKTVFISGEDLSALGPALTRRLQSACSKLFNSTTIILLLRNKKDYLYSSYKHNLLYGPPTGEIDFVRRQKFSPKDCVNAWSEINNVTLKLFSYESMKKDLLARFFAEVFGIVVSDNIKSNRSLDYLTLQMMNSFLKGQDKGLEKIVINISNKYPFDFTLPIEDVIAQNIDEQYSDEDWKVPGIEFETEILEKRAVARGKVSNPVALCEKMIELFTALKSHLESERNA